MQETVGKVKLNLDYYSGSDLYSDGQIEDVLLDIVSNMKQEDYKERILATNEWPLLYHLSAERENILAWYPFKSNGTVLEVGAGCGAVTGAMLDKVDKVTAVDLSKKRSMINANRHKDAENLEIYVGNFKEVEKHLSEKYDYITLIGVFEYAELYMGGENPYSEFLDIVNEHLKDNGKLLIAIENRLGLKYFAGCKEDHVGKYFEGINGYPMTSGVKTFSKDELIGILEGNGYSKYKFYYPYPDYKFANTIYSDGFLPKKGELYNNIRNFDADRFVLFDETNGYDKLIELNLFDKFSNSFLIEIEKKVG